MMRILLKQQFIFILVIGGLTISCNKGLHRHGISNYSNSLPTRPTVILTTLEINETSKYFSINPPIIITNNTLDFFDNFTFNQNLGRDYDIDIAKMIDEFYAITNHRTKWLGRDKPYPIFNSYLNFSKFIWKDGLDVQDYLVSYLHDEVTSAYREKDYKKLEQLDFMLTYSFLLLSNHISYGKINPEQFNGYWHLDKVKNPVFSASSLVKIQNDYQFRKYIDFIRPRHKQYEKLRTKLIELANTLETKGDYPVIDNFTTSLKPRTVDPALRLIRQRLSFQNEALHQTNDPYLYDEILQSAVIDFQIKNGLVADGEIGKHTVSLLNRTIQEEIDIIKINLERLRWLPDNYGANHIVINIPNFMLELFQDNQKTYEMRVVVGATKTKTPVFSDTLQYIVFSPTWTVPRSIKVREILPRLKQDSGYYINKNFKFYDNNSNSEINPLSIDWSNINSSNFNYNVVQQPGYGNALGKVKFIMPNIMNVYLHDTPSQRHFNRNRRNFSHGCIRLEEPAMLAKLLLKDHHDLDMKKIHRYMSQKSPKQINLKQNYHVQIEYRTAWVDDDGSLQMRPDIYGHDRTQARYYNQNALALID